MTTRFDKSDCVEEEVIHEGGKTCLLKHTPSGLWIAVDWQGKDYDRAFIAGATVRTMVNLYYSRKG